MSLFDVSVCHFTTIVRKPPDLLPVLLLVLQKHSLVLEIFTNLDHDVSGVIDLTSNVERVNSI